jgi:N-acetylmuramoyl-L-alanine amidase
MKSPFRRPFRLALLAALCAAVFVSGTFTRAAENGFPIYFESTKIVLKDTTVNRTTYLPLLDIVQFLKLTYTDAISLETFTIRSGASRLVLTKNSALISINDQIVLLRNPIIRENDRWLVPIDFLTQGLGRITGIDFRYRPGTSRIFAGNVQAPELVMNAQALGSITRLTIRVGAPAKLSVNRDDPKRAVISIDRTPIDPLRETVEHKDRLVQSIAYDDSDGNSKLVVATTDEVVDVRITPAEGNEIFFVDFMRRSAAGAQPEPVPTPEPAPPKVDQPTVPGQRGVRVVVLDPGHGGLDTGAKNASTMEKDLALTMARKIRTALQSRLGMTVLLTRDSDVAMDNEARSAVANNNQANVFISLHIGTSPNKMDSGSSVFVMKEDFGGPVVPTSGRDRLFLPWYLGYRIAAPGSGQVAKLLQDELAKAIPGWKFPLRSAPLGVLSSVTMPAVVLEIGNLNNSVNAQTLVDPGFQDRLAATIVTALQRFAQTQPAKF